MCPVVLHLFWTLSPLLENNHTFKYWSGIFPTILTWLTWLCWKIARTTFQCVIVSNPGEKILFLLKFYKARISEWNLWRMNSYQERKLINGLEPSLTCTASPFARTTQVLWRALMSDRPEIFLQIKISYFFCQCVARSWRTHIFFKVLTPLTKHPSPT